MTFDTYYDIMKNHGIGEFFFTFGGEECAVIMQFHNLQLVYCLSAGGKWESFDDLDACVAAPFFADGQCLRQIWDEIEISAVDGVSVEKYDAESCSFHYVQCIKDQGELLWSCKLGLRRSFWIQMKCAMMGAWILPALSILLPLTGNGNWNVLYLSGGCALFALLLGGFTLYRNRLDINYQITTKKIIIFNGLSLSMDFDNIRYIKICPCLFDRGRATIKLKKGLTLNYRLEHIPEPEKVFQMICDAISVKEGA